MSVGRTVRDCIERQATARPDATYAVATETGARLTFGDVARGARRTAAGLHALGVAPGDHIALVMPNGLGTLQLLLGAMHAGVAVTPVNLVAQPAQMRHVLDHGDSKAVFVAPDWEARVRGLLEHVARPVALVVADPDDPAVLDAGGAGRDAPAPDPQALALLMYTSGTTGMPKGVMLTQANLAANAHAIADEHALGPADRVLGVLPLYHINAFAVTMLAPLASGGSVALAPRFSAGRFWQQASAHACTWLNVVPTMISYLLEGELPERTQTSRLRFCRSASAALPPEHLRAFEARFGIGVIETMGLTETVAPSFSNPLEPARRKLGSVGRASGCEARVIDGQFLPVTDGTTGEIAIRGPNVMSGYYKDPAASAGAFTPDGWLRTGDLGHRDPDGFFFVTGRIKELIIKGGANIAPREIDEALLAHPAVLEAAAVGIPDRHYGQEILACVVLRSAGTCTEEELRAHCEAHLGPYKTPKTFRFVAELPRGPSGKVQRLKLLEIETPGTDRAR